jgi:hypothetical protein
LDYHAELEQLLDYVQDSEIAANRGIPLHLPGGVRKLGVLSIISAGLGAFLLPVGIAAVVFGSTALRKLKTMPGSTLWRWIAWAGILFGTLEILLILGALADGLGRASTSGKL